MAELTETDSVFVTLYHECEKAADERVRIKLDELGLFLSRDAEEMKLEAGAYCPFCGVNLQQIAEESEARAGAPGGRHA